MWHSAKAPCSDSRTFFGLHLSLAARCCKNLLRASGPEQSKSGSGITCLVSVTIFCIIFSITIHLHLASFYAQNTVHYLKKKASENAY